MRQAARLPAAAGRFYPAGRHELESAVMQALGQDKAKREKAVAAVCPHAGYIYSGAVAGAVYSSLEISKTVILIGPNHTGFGPEVSIMDQGSWRVPNGELKVDTSLAKAIMGRSALFKADSSAHVYEHSLEVQVPFICHLRPDAMIVPITIMRAARQELETIGKSIAEAVRAAYNKRPAPLIIASSDMSHYVSDNEARNKDALAIRDILALDPAAMLETVHRNNISMCGVLPVAAMLYAAMELGVKDARLVKYATSAETSGDFEHVVGYAGIIVK
ncbi:MAG: AmmeMemoRadiSam system protein B [Nitrospiraceae bacterium]|nr:AmmeMemoRadiSam system protein B [Nitrospiraceae bacterium]